MKSYKTGVINDPLGQGKDVWTDTLCENSDHYRPGLWSASGIN